MLLQYDVLSSVVFQLQRRQKYKTGEKQWTDRALGFAVWRYRGTESRATSDERPSSGSEKRG